MGTNGNGRFNETGTAVAPISIAASIGNRCSCRFGKKTVPFLRENGFT